MKLKVLKEYRFGTKLGSVRSCSINLGYEMGMLFAYSEDPPQDPYSEYLGFHHHPVHLAVYGAEGQQLWDRTLPMGVIPGVWFLPFIAHDMDGDGVDEVWFLNNPSDKPLRVAGRVMERLDARTGKTIGTYPFEAANCAQETVGEAYRYMIFGGYVHGEPVLIAQQGTYRDMHLQCYNADMTLRWRKVIAQGNGPRAAHHVPILDINRDGVDEFLFGEHLLSMDDGSELICYAPSYQGHSDVVLPFVDYTDGKGYVFTVRENGNYKGCPRVVTFDDTGKTVWEDVYYDPATADGHMHCGFVYNARDGKKIAVAVHDNRQDVYGFEAVSGKPVELPFDMARLRPIDWDGDGVHDFVYGPEGIQRLDALDPEGKLVACLGGTMIQIGKWYDFPGEQLLSFYTNEGVVRLWGDAEAKDSEILLSRHKNGNRRFMNKMTGCGYNWLSTIDSMG